MIDRKKKGNEPEEIEVNRQKYESVHMFKCPGSVINTNEVEAEIKAGINVTMH
jgi:hypothetical protein